MERERGRGLGRGECTALEEEEEASGGKEGGFGYAKRLRGIAERVPIAALVSYDDIYVERHFSEETAALLGREHCKLWVTNEFQHSGLGDDGERVFETLLRMSDDEISLPS